jgi:hypothetical protein
MLRELLRMEIAPIGSTHLSTFFDERTAQRVQFGGQGIDIRFGGCRWRSHAYPSSSRCFRNIRISSVVEGETAEFCRG